MIPGCALVGEARSCADEYEMVGLWAGEGKGLGWVVSPVAAAVFDVASEIVDAAKESTDEPKELMEMVAPCPECMVTFKGG